MSILLRRREFIAGLGGAAACPLAARAQRLDKVRRVGVIMGFFVQNSEVERWVVAFERKLGELGWKDGIDLKIEYRWPGNPPDRLRAGNQPPITTISLFWLRVPQLAAEILVP